MVDDLTSRKVNIRDVRKDLITRAELNSLRDELSELKGSLRFKKKIDKLSYDVDFLKSESLDVEALHDHVESMKSKLFTREEFRKENVHTNNEIRLIVDALEDLQGSVPVKAKLDFLELELSEMEGKYITRKRFNDSRRKIIHNISELKEKINKNRKNNKSSNGDDIRKLNYQINVLKEELEESYNTFENVKYDLSREFEQKYGYTLTTNNSVKKNVKTAVSRSAKKSRKRDIRSNEPAPKLIEKVKDGVTGFFTEEIDDLPKRAVKNKSGIAHNN